MLIIRLTTHDCSLRQALADSLAVFAPCAHAGNGCRHSPSLTSSQRMRTRAQLRHRTTDRTDWSAEWASRVQSIASRHVAVKQLQGGRIAGPGAYDVTDSKFSTSIGTTFL